MNHSRELYLTGRIRVYETRLFNRAAFSRFLESSSAGEFISELKDTPYGSYIQGEDLDGACSEYIDHAYMDFRKDMGRGRAAIDAFMLHRELYRDIKKRKKSEKEEKKRASFEKIPLDGLREKVQKIEKENKEIKDREIEQAAIEAASVELMKKVSSAELLQLWESYIDIKNFLNNISHTAPGYYLPGGYIHRSFWEKADCRKEIPSKLKARPFMKEILKEKNSEEYELILNKWQGEMLKSLRKKTFGPEPVCAYILSLVAESKNLMTSYTGIRMGLKKEEIKKRLNYSYV